MKVNSWLYALLCVFINLSCNSQNAPTPLMGPGTKNDKPKPVPGKNAGGNILKLTKHQVIDREGSGMVASNYLLPEGWKVTDRLYWEYNDATVPIRYKGTYQSPDGSMVIKNFPDVRAVWSTGPTGTTGNRPPAGIIDGLKDLVKLEKGAIRFRYTDEKTFPAATQSTNISGSAVRQVTQTGLIRIEYEENGSTFEEEYYGTLDVSNVVSQGVVTYQSVIWAASNLYSCRALKGQLEKCKQIALTLKSTARPTLPFYNRYVQVVKLLSDQVYQNIYQAGQISKIISETNDKISETITSSYWNTQKVYEKTNQQFSDNLRGVERYQDGNAEYQLPSGYSNAWVNQKGEYLMSDQPGFDPSVVYGENWKPLNKK